MKYKPDLKAEEKRKTPVKVSPVKALVHWLIEADREYRVTQSMVNERHDKI